MMKWRSLWARLTDYFLLFMGMTAAISFLPYFIDLKSYLLLAALTPVAMIPVEALFLHYLGTTPGKALFDIRVKAGAGNNLSLKDSLKRAVSLHPKSEIEEMRPLSFKHRFTALFVGVGCIILTFFGNAFSQWSMGLGKGVGNAEGWIEYASEKGFTVQLPEKPSREHHVIELPDANQGLDYHSLTSYQNKHVHYSVSHIDFPKKWTWAGPSRLLKTALDGVLSYAPGAEVLGKRFTTHQGYKALDFILKKDNEEVRGRIILVGTRLYALTMTYPSEADIDFNEIHFMDSFDVKR